MPRKKVHPTEKASGNLTIHKMVPNMMTIAALCAGLTSIQFAISGRWEAAVMAIVIAAFIDGFDGAAARLLNASSKLGAELDSLSDFLCFGIAPTIVLYLWALEAAGRFGWMAALVYSVAVALRLARFNAMTKEETDKKNPLNMYFVGVPAPMGAGMAILPMVVAFQLDNPTWTHFLQQPVVAGSWALMFAGLMVSRVPTFSSKQVKLSQKLVVPVLATFGLIAAGLINAPWPTLTLLGILYGILIPAGAFHFYYTQRKLKK